MRLWISALAVACADLDAPSGGEASNLREEAAPEIVLDCADDACDALTATLEPAPSEPAVWLVDGEPVEGDWIPLGEKDGSLTIDAVLADGTGRTALVSHQSDPAGPLVVILGFQSNSCDQFYISTVGGCLTASPTLRFDGQRRNLPNGVAAPVPSVRFQVQPSFALLALGHATSARWPGGSTASAPPTVTQGGVTYWFKLSQQQELAVSPVHEWPSSEVPFQPGLWARCGVNGPTVSGTN